jgi:hypothetical protein
VDLVSTHHKERTQIKGDREHTEKNILTYDRGSNKEVGGEKKGVSLGLFLTMKTEAICSSET